MIEFKRTELKFNVYGEAVSMRLPNTKEFLDYQGKIKEFEEDEKKAIDIMLTFFDELGLKRDLAEEMEMQHLVQIAETIADQKKS